MDRAATASVSANLSHEGKKEKTMIRMLLLIGDF